MANTTKRLTTAHRTRILNLSDQDYLDETIEEITKALYSERRDSYLVSEDLVNLPLEALEGK